MVEEYAKRWKVSKEEAAKRIMKFLGKYVPSEGDPKGSEGEEQRGGEGRGQGEKPREAGQADVMPRPDFPFATPLGEISRKVMDLNQAALSSAYTLRMLRAPPEDVAALREELKRVYADIMDLKGRVDGEIKRIADILDEKRRKEEREALLKEINERLEPIRRSVDEVTKRFEELERRSKEAPPQPPSQPAQPPQPPPARPESLAEEIKKIKGAVEDLKAVLTELGYRVEPDKVSWKDVEEVIRKRVEEAVERARQEALASLTPEEMKRRLEAAGYKVVGGPMTWDQVEKLINEVKKRAYEEALEDKRVDAVKSILESAISRVIGEILGPVVRAYFPQVASQALPAHPTPEAVAATAQAAQVASQALQETEATKPAKAAEVAKG
jgi:hypothetical protein